MNSIKFTGFFVALTLLVPAIASANNRHFTYTYESATLPAGSAELEPWTTWRVGREQYYNRFDHRLEFEYGLTDRLMAALYLNWNAQTASDGTTRASSFNYAGVSSEFKYRVLDDDADGIGLALYLEITGATDELEFEEKLILDKRFGDLLFAANLVVEQELEFGEDETEVEHHFELDAGLAYFFNEHCTVGLELRNHSIFEEGELEASAFFLGPNFSYGAEAYWIAASILPQLFAIKGEEEGGEEDDSLLDLDHHEMVNARILLGFHL